MKVHEWTPTSDRSEHEDGKMVEGWGRCVTCGVDAYVAKEGGAVMGFLIGTKKLGYRVNPDCMEVLVETVMGL